jgi:anaphase-promoting complex subunit 5
MEHEAPPPTEHVLRPHHVALLSIFILIFKTFHSGALPPPFTLHVYRLLLSEVSEVGQHDVL